MSTDRSSLEIYSKIPREFPFGKAMPTPKDLESLLKAMKAELLIYGYSPLLDAAWNECANFCAAQRMGVIRFEPSHYRISSLSRRHVLPAFDAWQLPIFLADDMSGVLPSGALEEALPYFWGNFVPQKPDPRRLLRAFQTIDLRIVDQRRNAYLAAAGRNPAIGAEPVITELDIRRTEEKLRAILREAEEQKTDIIALAEAEARCLVEAARQQGEQEKQAIMEAAQQQAQQLLSDASLRAENKLTEARKRILELSAHEKFTEFSAEQEDAGRRFGEVREALVKANESIKRLEDAVCESVTKKAYTQLIELYNLIADTRDSTLALASQTNTNELENAAYNMDVFLDMLVEYLADYGVQTILTLQGEPFCAKRHGLRQAGLQFDPRTATVARSLRNGFIWGEQVLQKELVEIEGDQHVSWN